MVAWLAWMSNTCQSCVFSSNPLFPVSCFVDNKRIPPTKPWPLWPDKSLTCFTWDRWGKLCGLQAVRMLILKDFFKKIHWSRRSNTSSRFDMKIPHEGGWGSSQDSSTMWWFLSHFWQEELKIDLCMFLKCVQTNIYGEARASTVHVVSRSCE